MGARADDLSAKQQMYSAINEEGFVYQGEIESDPRNKVVLNTINVLMLGAGFNTDLVNPTMLLPITADSKK